ncbi:Fe-S cluster assembly sulfur transfer protein SufU [Miniphocaeibacter massiliensis]|uniref:Fe-S cluster assembly sulfur transfer protein SufU n=1 Tax=Miniphocaeibacter massiliensis TaxID=2041841 RepID=UPI000C1C59F1|nr:SUF system NifU family Fe-S cluster assembly protein [Miniphocaeibacter massiliensis]
MDLNQLYSEVILEHNQDTRNKRELNPYTLEERGHNPSCGDDITLRLNIEDGIVKDAAYTGIGCAISQASTSIMIDDIKGLKVEEAYEKLDLFLKMIRGEVDDEELLEEELEEGIVFKNISTMPARVKCAVLAWHTLKEALDEKKEA